MEFRVLGPLHVVADDRRLDLGGPKQRAVLALLVATASRGIDLQTLITGAYGEDAPPSAKRSIYTYVSNLRQDLGDLITREGDTYRLGVDALQIDSARFESRYVEGKSLLDDDPHDAAKVLRAGLSLWTGHAYKGIDGGPVIDGESRRLNELRVSALQARIDADLALGRHRDVIGELEALVAEYPLQERFRAQQMLALYRADRQSDALRTFKRLRDLLADQLGVEPGPEITHLEDRILRQDPALDLDRKTTRKRAILVSQLPDFLESADASQRETVMAKRDHILDNALSFGEATVTLRGSAAYVVLENVLDALEVARKLSSQDMRVAVDLGQLEIRNGEIAGSAVGRSARLVAAANPGQILISEHARTTLRQSEVAGLRIEALGRYHIRGIDGEPLVFQAAPLEVEQDFPPLQANRLPPPIPGWQPTISGYELRNRLDEHEHGILYDAYQHSVGREVSILVFHPRFVSTPGFIRRFEAEAQRLTHINHPYVVPVLDFWREPERAVIVYRAHGSQSLSVPRIRGPDMDLAASVVASIGRGLSSAHEAGVVHGGLRPSWIEFDTDGDPALSGLGLTSITNAAVPPSVRKYAAPEVLEGRPTPSSDIFALAIITAELLTGHSTTSRLDMTDVTQPVAEVLRKATDPDPSSRPTSMRAFVEEFTQAIDARAVGRPDRLTDARNPYKGLSPFTEPDAEDFFGRDEMIAELVDCVASNNLSIVVGPSGIGKSSIVKAGLIPAIRSGALNGSEDWLVTDMFPGPDPFHALAGALERISVHELTDDVERLRTGQASLASTCEKLLGGEHGVIVVDQLEELFTHTANEEDRDAFLSKLAELVREPYPRLKVVATLRADFLDRPLDHAEFGAAIRKRIVTLQALSRKELTDAIRLPAEQVGVIVDDDLVAMIINDAADEPGTLPLLQYTLADLFERRSLDRLTLADYRSSGGLVGAIGRRAERVYLELSPDLRATARSVFLSLVTVDEESEDTRRRVRLHELEQFSHGPHAVEEVLGAFGQARLLTFDRSAVSRGPTVELAHEAILREWDRLAGWIDAVRDDLLIRRRVATAAREWDGSDRDPSYLLEGGQLEHTENWFRRTGLELTGIEEAFLSESREAFEISQRKRRKTRRLVITGLIGGLLGALLLGVLALIQGRVAETRALENQVAELTSASLLQMEQDPQLAMLLALEAYDRSLDLGQIPPEVSTALQATMQQSRLERIIDDGAFAVAASPDGRLLATQGQDDQRRLHLYDLENGRRIGSERWLRFPIAGLSFHPDGSSLAVTYDRPGSAGGGNEPAMSVLEVPSLETRSDIPGGASVVHPTHSADGLFVAGYDPTNGVARVFDTRHEITGTELRLESQTAPAFIGDTSVVAYSLGDMLHLLDVSSEMEVDRIRLDATDYDFLAAAPQGDLLTAVSRDSGRVVIVDVRQGRIITTLGDFESPYLATFSPDGSSIVVASTDNTVIVVDLDSMARIELPGHGVITDVEFSDERVVVSSLDGGIKVWRPERGDSSTAGSIRFGQGEVIRMTSAPGVGRASAIVLGDDRNATAVIVDLSTNEVIQTMEFEWEPEALPVLSDDGRLAAGLLPGTSHAAVVDLESGELLLNLEPCEIPKGLGLGSDLVAVTANCSAAQTRGDERHARTGLISISDGTMVMSLASTGRFNQVAIGEPGSVAADLALVGVKANLTVWQISTGNFLGNWVPPDVFRTGRGNNARWADAIASIDFTDDGSIGVIAYQTGHLAAFDMEAIRTEGIIRQANLFLHRAHAGSLRFAEATAGSIVTAGSEVRGWDPRTGRLQFEFLANTSAATLTPDGSNVYIEAGDGLMRRVPLEAKELAELARTRITREMTDQECRRYTPNACDAALPDL